MSWVAVGVAGASLVKGAMDSRAAGKAASAQQKGYDAATAEQARQYDQSREDQMPWLQAGQSALGQLSALAGGDFSGFKASPDYQFARDQGLQGLDRSAAARGAMYSGGADADRMSFASGLASQEYGNHWNRLAGLANVGQSTASNLASLGQNYANNVGNNAIGAANSRASGYQAKGQAWGNALSGVVGGIGYGYGNNWGRT